MFFLPQFSSGSCSAPALLLSHQDAGNEMGALQSLACFAPFESLVRQMSL